MIKALFSDMDYTLLRPSLHHDERVITDEDCDAILQMQKDGFHFVVTTGRFSPSVFRDLKSRGIQCDMISSGGSAIYINGELKELYQIDLAVIEAVFNDIINLNPLTYFRFADERHKYMIRFENLDNSLNDKDIEAYKCHFKNTEYTPNKISISFNTDEEMNEIKKVLIEKYGDYFYIEQSMPTNLDLTKSGINKGSAIRYMLDYYGISKEEAAGIGDSYNDFAIFSDVNLTFAVDIGVDKLKEAADYVVVSIAEAYQIIKTK